jgi:hypothetical protein
MALFLGAIVVFNIVLLQLLEIGTCASGNTPYEISRPCPEGTGTKMLLLTGSIFVGLIGAGLFAFRGEPPWSKGRGRMSFGGMFGAGTFAWGLFFTATGATMLIAAISDDSLSAGSDLGGKIVGITFLVMGVPALLIALWGLIGSIGKRDERPAAAGPAGMGDIASRMIGGLRSSPLGSIAGGGSSGRRGSGDAIGKLERLQKLKESGAINQSEFDKEKAKILAEQ